MPDASSLLLGPTQAVALWQAPPRSTDDFAARQKLSGRGLTLKETEFGFCPAPEALAEAPWVGFTLNGLPCAVQSNWGQLRRFTGLPLEGLTPGDAALLVEDKASLWLEAFEEKTGLAVRLTDIVPGKALPFQIGLSCGSQVVRMGLSEQAITALSAALPYLRVEVPGSFAVALKLEFGTFELPAAELKALCPGDALAWESAPDHLRLIAQDSHSAGAKWAEAGLELTTAFGRIMQGEHLGMASELDAGQAGSMDDLDVRISVRAGEALMTLGDLRKLGPGTILPMTEPETDHVDLVVNGKRIGTGQLVTVGGTRAVEIKDLFGDG